MTKYDSVTEAVIEASPSECWDALMEEAEGRSTWWRPYVTLRRRGDIPADQVGSVLEVAANAHPEHRIGTARWAERTVVLEPGHKKVMENFEGAFRGTTTWTFEPVDSGRTRVTVRFAADPAGVMKLLSRLVDVNAVNRKVFDECFRGMQQHLIAKKGHPG
jgi:hypothetical protein